jgi:O-antigen ligase
MSLVFFGSLASVVALGTALTFLMRTSVPRFARPWCTAAMITMLGMNVYFVMEGPPEWAYGIGRLFGKEVQHLETMSGRLPLWRTVWETTNDAPFGLGFAAAERSFVVLLVQLRELGWAAKNAHNGYLSAWMGAGWPGVAILLMLFVSLYLKSRSAVGETRTLIQALILLLIVNNLTIAAVGGPYSPVFMLTMALACAPLEPAGQTRRAEAHPHADPLPAHLLPAARW